MFTIRKFKGGYMLKIIIIFVSLVFFDCSTVPITGRRQLSLIPSSQMMSMSFQQYGDFLKTNQISRDNAKTAMVKKVGRNIQLAVEEYFRQKGISNELKGFEWEFNLVDNNQVNAWCMPGGKVVIYTGILPLTQDETGLAVVMGHEIAHAVAKHGNERMSQGLLTQFGGLALSEAIKSKPEETKKLWLGAFGLGAQIGVLLPYSRTHEYEADRLGAIFMALAGYDPRGAIDFWKRMSSMNKGKSIPEFLSTHPVDSKRIEALKKVLPEAEKYYRKR